MVPEGSTFKIERIFTEKPAYQEKIWALIVPTGGSIAEIGLAKMTVEFLDGSFGWSRRI